ncbi:conserved Plasmodium protein, unknown function [Plasmodium gallinaceum]|uniref:Uncharacterized protein n=1 Tax=Plasmodium gallinaceum TaxID=5849 RepID=A0A1J1H078_PLAGA|nr:conserved Plasmodium protein, unknown function [Plasmodium gallinaceum]CRG96684.1 conserved Plasmodium protein, unknown function [Plasmodium gallinaceum]
MDDHSVLKELKKSEYNSEIFLNCYFGTLIKKNDDNEILISVNNLKKEIQGQKNYMNDKIREEIENYKEKMYQMKRYTNIMNENLLNLNIIYKKGKNISNMMKKNNLYKLKKKKKKGNEEETNIRKENFEENKKDEWNDNFESDIEREYKIEGEEIHEDEKKDNEDNEFKLDESKNNLKFENLLIKSIEAKTKLENIKKGLLFLKVFPTLKKDMNEMFSTTKNMKLDIDDKMKNIFTLLKNLIYINENEQIITYFKENSCIDISLYSNKFFDDFFTLLNDILYSYIFDKVNINISEILKAYIILFKTYLKFTNIKTYKNEYLINEIIKKIIEFIIINFNKIFLKFVYSENDSFFYNSIINFYEYFTTFIEERKEIIEKMIFIIIYIVNNKNENKLNEFSDTMCLHTNSILNDKNLIETSIEKAEVEAETGDISNENENKMSEENLTEINIDKINYKEKNKSNDYLKSEDNNINEDFSYIEDYFVHLFKESINIVCNYIENSDIIKNLDSSNKNDKAIMNKNKNFIFKIMESLKISLGILSNSSFFISKKNLLEKILRESTFINKVIINEYIYNVTRVQHFDMEYFENINLKVSNFDRNNFLSDGKLLIFFKDIQNDIKNTIEKKYYEVNNKDIFNYHFFRFVIFFSFISNHDTEFLFLFINIYNFLYEITYNIKEEVIKIKNEIDKKKKSQIKINESLQLKEEFNVSNKIIDYIKNIIIIFTKLLNIFNDITKEYENFGSFIFEKTYNYFISNSIFNCLSKFYLQKEKYPSEIEANILHIHNFFFNEDFLKKLINVKNKGIIINENIPNNVNSNENNLILPKKSEIKINEESFSNNLIIQMDKSIPDNFIDINLDIENEECGKHLFKLSLSKLNEIKNTILKNIIYFSLIPLYDYLIKYVSKIVSLNDNEKIESFDPEENICLIVETIFTYIEIFYENKNDQVLQQLFFHLSEKYVFYIKNIDNLNKNMILQIQSDVNYLINVCKKFKIKNYKQFLLLYHSISYSFTLKTDQDLNIQSSFELYLNEHIKNENELCFNITNNDILKSTFFIKQFLSHQQIKD